MNRAPDTPEVVLRLRGVCKRYGSITAVSNLDLDVHDAEVMALLGPNGAGKTTTVEMCEGFVRPDAGSIEVLGLDPITDNARLRGLVLHERTEFAPTGRTLDQGHFTGGDAAETHSHRQGHHIQAVQQGF